MSRRRPAGGWLRLFGHRCHMAMQEDDGGSETDTSSSFVTSVSGDDDESHESHEGNEGNAPNPDLPGSSTDARPTSGLPGSSTDAPDLSSMPQPSSVGMAASWHQARRSLKYYRCGWCKRRVGDGVHLYRCSGCYLVKYCSENCNRAGWSVHRPLCRAVRGIGEGA
jgi:hypothetical protein